jgi:hypothetical protein
MTVPVHPPGEWTPGPWKVADRGKDLEINPTRTPFYSDSDYDEIKGRYPSGRSGCVAVVVVSRSGAKRGQPVRYYPNAAHRANAHLISAAPDLLAALEQLLNAAGTAGYPEAVGVARNAIAKATGTDR